MSRWTRPFVYGNYGWGNGDTASPVGAYGIVRFSPELEPDWHYPVYRENPPWGPIDDCYALNVDGDCAWACYYSDFPVVLIRGDRVTGWHNDVQGAKALAVAESRVALFGGYGPDYDRLAVTALDGDRARPAGEYRIVLPDGEELPAGAQVVGREDRLHVLIGTSWYQLAVGDIPATRPPGPRYRRTWPCGARCACTATPWLGRFHVAPHGRLELDPPLLREVHDGLNRPRP